MKFLMMIFVLLSSFHSMAGAAAPTAAPASTVHSYKEWKSEKVQVALNQISVTRNEMIRWQSAGQVKTAEALRKQMVQLQWNLEVANDLSVTDYFVLYLSQQPQADRYQQAAQKLNAAEVAELMEAYSVALGVNSIPSTTAAASNSTVTARKIPVQADKNSQ